MMRRWPRSATDLDLRGAQTQSVTVSSNVCNGVGGIVVGAVAHAHDPGITGSSPGGDRGGNVATGNRTAGCTICP